MKEEYADGIKIIKRKSKGKVIGVLLIVLVCFGMVTLLAELLSKTISVGNFSIVSLIFGNGEKIDERKYYAVALGEYDKREAALEVAMGASVAGASGFVWEKDNKFYPIGSIYKNKEAAEIVKTQLDSSVYSISILDIDFKEVVIDERTKEQAVCEMIYESLNYLDELFNNFEKHSIQLEKNEITFVAAASFINAYAGEIRVFESKMQYLIEEYKDETLKKIKNGFVAIETSLNNTVSTLLSNFSPISDVKYGLVDFVYNYYSLILSL